MEILLGQPADDEFLHSLCIVDLAAAVPRDITQERTCEHTFRTTLDQSRVGRIHEAVTTDITTFTGIPDSIPIRIGLVGVGDQCTVIDSRGNPIRISIKIVSECWNTGHQYEHRFRKDGNTREPIDK